MIFQYGCNHCSKNKRLISIGRKVIFKIDKKKWHIAEFKMLALPAELVYV